MLRRPKPRSFYAVLRFFDRVGMFTCSPRARVVSLARAVLCVRCELVYMSEELERLFVCMMILKMIAVSLGY
jgi:hypothetical protein